MSEEWVEVEGVPGEIGDIDATYSEFLNVTGTARDGGPLLAAVDADVVLRVARRLPDSHGSGASSPTGDYGNEGLVQQVDAALGRPAHLFVGQLSPAYTDISESWYRDVVRDRALRPATWASLLFDDEGDVRAVGATQATDGRWRAHLWEVHPDDGRWRLEERGRGPLLAQPPDPGTLVTSTEEVSVWLAESTDGGARLWRIEANPYAPGRWQRVRLAGGADRVTDILSWAIGTWVAGSRDGRAVVWDFDGDDELAIPDIALDEDTPLVQLLRLDVVGQPAFAVQAPDGPSVWLRGRGAWRELKAPEGTLSRAAASDKGIYLVIDGRLWFRPLAWDEEFP